MPEFVNSSSQGDIRLMDLKDQMVALQFRQDGPSITTTMEDGQVVTSHPAQADVYSFNGSEATHHGTTLVFPQVIRQAIKAQAPAYVLGWLRERAQKSNADRTVVLLEPLTEEELTSFRQAVTNS